MGFVGIGPCGGLFGMTFLCTPGLGPVGIAGLTADVAPPHCCCLRVTTFGPITGCNVMEYCEI